MALKGLENTANDINNEIIEIQKKIKNGKMDMSLGELANMYDEGDLIIDQAFQGFFRWDNYQKTRFIESILVGIPTPSIFVVEDEEGKWEIVEGLQRLATVFSFMGKNGFRQWKLDEGDLLKKIGGLSYDDLPTRTKNLIRRFVCRVEIIYPESGFNIRREIFERLNTGVSSLSDQEIRNAIYLPDSENFNEFLREMANDEDFVNLIRVPDKQLGRLYGEELVLRFCSLLDSDVIAKNLPIHLNDFMRDMVNRTKDDLKPIEDLKSIFKRVVGILTTLDEIGIFWRENGGFSPGLYDGIMVGVAQNIDYYEDNLNLLAEKIEVLKNSRDFDGFSGSMADNGKNVSGRIRVANEIFGSA